MDLFTSTPVKSGNPGKSAPGVLEPIHFASEGSIPRRVETDGNHVRDEELDRSMEEADFAASFQSRSLDPSLYTTYSDLSSFLPGAQDDDYPVSDPDEPEPSPTPADTQGSFDAASLSLLKSRSVNRSLESVLSELERISRSNNNCIGDDDNDFGSAPQHRSLSADNVWREPSESDPDNQSASNLADGNKLNSGGYDGNILVSGYEEDTTPDRVETERTRNTDSSLAERSAGRFVHNGITPASRAVTNHAAFHNVSRGTRGEGISHYSDVTYAASITNGESLQYTTILNNGSYADRPVVVDECAITADVREQLESSAQPPAWSPSRGDAVESKMASKPPKEKRSGKGKAGATTESDLMTVIEALRREAASWEEKYQELKQRRVSQSDDSKDYVKELKSRDADAVVVELQSLLRDAEGNLVDAREEIEELKEEIDELKLELEEAADRVREGDLEEFRDLKHDLDQVTKECRILQYRLRKSDRKLEQVEHEKSELEAKLKLLLDTPVSTLTASGDAAAAASGDAGQSGSGKASATSSNAGTSDEEDKAMEKEIANLKQQLKVAKDVSVRLHQELELIEEKRARTEEDNQLLRNRLMDSESARKDLKRDLEKSKLEVEFLRRKIAKSEAEGASQALREKVQVLRSSVSSEDDANAEYDIAALLNDLQESTDREHDLQSQLQLLEEEGEVLRKGLVDTEQEKEAVDFELERYKMRFGTLDDPKRQERGVASEKEAELRLQLMVTEQEATVMRRKIMEFEVKNEELEGALARLSERLPDEDEGDKLPKRQTPIGQESTSSSPSKTEIDGSEDSDGNSLRQQIASLEQENGTLRMKVTSLEEAESFLKTCVGKVSRTVNDSGVTRLSSVDFENIIDSLKRRLAETEFRNRCYELEIQTLTRLNEFACMPRDTHAKPSGRPKSVESKIRGQLALMHNEADMMRRKVISLEMANEKLQEEVDQRGAESETPEGERLSALQDKIIQLEEELGDLLTILRSKEISESQQNQEMITLRDNIDKLQLESESRTQEFRRKLSDSEYNREMLEQQLKITKERAESMQNHLKRLCAGSADGQAGEGSVSDEVFDKEGKTTETPQTPEVEKIFNERITALEHELAEERTRVSSMQKESVERTLNQTCQQLMSPSGDEGEKELLSFELDETRFEIEDLKDEMTKAQESLQRKVENLTDMNEELKVSNDLLAQERTRLQDRLNSVDKKRIQEEVRAKQEKANVEGAMSELRRQSDREQSELKRALKDLQSEVDKLSAEKESLESKEKELIDNFDHLNKLFEDAEAAGEASTNKWKRTEVLLEKQTKEFDERLQKEVTERTNEVRAELQKTTLEMKAKTDEIKHLTTNISKLKEEVESLKTNARRVEQSVQTSSAKTSWAGEKARLQAEVTSLQKRLSSKEDSWKAERAKSLREVSDLRQKLKDRDGGPSDKKRKEIESRLEAATELVESYKTGEARFMDERKRILKQNEEKDQRIRKLEAEISQFSKDQSQGEESKRDYERRLQRQEKVWKNELSVYRFKLEAETRYFTEELGRLQKRLESETIDYSSLKSQMSIKEEDCQRLKVLLEASQQQCKEAKIEQEKDHLTAKRTRQLLDDAQREKRELSLQLANQRSRCEMLQRGIAGDKAAWQVTNTELQARISRLEQQTKLKKVKLEELQSRLQAAWDQERAENMRLLTEANQKILQLESQVQEGEERRQLDATTVREGYKRDQKIWEDESAKLSVKVRERDQEMLSLKEREKNYSQIDERFQRERELWRRERTGLVARLQESLETRKEDLRKLEELISQVNELKEPSKSTSLTSSPVRAKSTPPLTTKTRKEIGLSWPLHKQPSDSHIPATIPEDKDAAFKKVMDQLAFVQDDLNNYKRRIRYNFANRLKRSVSECDIDLSAAPRQVWLPKARASAENIARSDKQMKPIEGASLATKWSDLTRPLVEKTTVSKTSTVRHESSSPAKKEPIAPPTSRTYQASSYQASSSVTVKTVKTVTLQKQSQQDTDRKPTTPTRSDQSPAKHEPAKNGVKSGAIVVPISVGESSNMSEVAPKSINGDDATLKGTAVLKLDITSRNASEPATIQSDSKGSLEKNGAKSPVTPLEVKSGRFDAKSFLRETDRKGSPNLRNTASPSKNEIRKRLEEMDKSLVTSTKKKFEADAAVKSPQVTRVAVGSSSGGSPARSDSDSSDRDRHTDTEVVVRRQHGQVSQATISPPEASPKRTVHPQSAGSAENIARNADSSRPWSPRPGESISSRSSPRTSPSSQTPRYPCAPPGFLLPKQIKTPPSSSDGPPDAPAPTPLKAKPYNVPIAPSELAAFNEAPMKVLPGQLSKTKGEIQLRMRQLDSPRTNEGPSVLAQRTKLGTVMTEEQAKRISPRSARANFFAEIPGATAGMRTAPGSATLPPNGNNNYLTKTKDPNANTSSIGRSGPGGRLGPPVRASPWSATPAAAITRTASRGRAEPPPVTRRNSSGASSSLGKSSKPR